MLSALIALLGNSQDTRAIDLLTAALTQKEASLRPAMLQALGNTQNPRVVGTLVYYLIDTDPAVRAQAARSLGSFDDAHARANLFKVLTDPNPLVRQYAAISLANTRDPRVVKELLAQLPRAVGWDRGLIIDALGRTRSTAIVAPLLKYKDNPQFQREVYRALVWCPDPRAERVVLAALHGKSEMLRQLVLQDISSCQYKDRPALVGSLLHDPSVEVRRRATTTLAQWYHQDNFDPLCFLLTDKDAIVRCTAVEGLRNSADKRALPALQERMTGDADISVRVAAVRAVLSLSPNGGADTFRALAKSPNVAIRRAAVENVNVYVAHVEDVMLTLLKDPDAGVRAAAAGRAGYSQQAANTLIALLKDPSVDVRVRAINGLMSKRNFPQVVPALLPLATAPEGRIRQVVMQALSGYTEGEVSDVLYAGTSDPEMEVRIEALRSLARNGDPRAVTVATGLLKEPATPVQLRKAALEACYYLGDARTTTTALDLLKAQYTGGDLLTGIGAIRDPYHNLYIYPDEPLDAVLGQVLCCRADTLLPAVKAMLADANPEQRALGVALLVNSPDPRALPLLTTALGDKDARVRRLAARALRTLGDVRALDPLVATLQDANEGVVAEAALALGALQDTRAVEPLQALLDAPNVDVRFAAVWALEKIADPRSLDTLQEVYPDADPQTQVEIITAFGRMADRRAGDLLLSALKDDTAEVRLCAITALGKIKEPRAVEALCEIAKQPLPTNSTRRRMQRTQETIPGIRTLGYADPRDIPFDAVYEQEEAARALAAIGDPKAIPALAEWLRSADRRSDDVKTIVDTFHDPRLLDPLIAHLASDQESSVSNAVYCLTPSPIREMAIPPLLQALQSQNATLRLHAMRAISSIIMAQAYDAGNGTLPAAAKDPRLLPTLRALLPGAAGEMRVRLLTALKLLGDTQGTDTLLAAVHDKDTGVRSAMREALYAWRDAKAVPSLCKLLKDSDAEIRSAAYYALSDVANRHEAGMADQLVPLLADTDGGIRWRAAVLLCTLGDARGVDPVIALLNKKNPGAVGDDQPSRMQLLSALVNIDDPRARKAIHEVSVKSTPSMMSSILYSLWRSKTPGTLEPVLESVQHELTPSPTAPERCYSPTMHLLLAYMRRYYERAPTSTVTSMFPGKLADPRVQELCLTLLHATARHVSSQEAYRGGGLDVTLRQQAIWALGVSGATRTVPEIINALDSGTIDERKEAAIALGRLKDSRAVAPLITALRHLGADARPAVADALKAITGQDFGSDAERWQAWVNSAKL